MFCDPQWDRGRTREEPEGTKDPLRTTSLKNSTFERGPTRNKCRLTITCLLCLSASFHLSEPHLVAMETLCVFM